MFREPHVIGEHVDARQKVWIDIILVFGCQVLCVAKQGHRDNIHLGRALENLPAMPPQCFSLEENVFRFLFRSRNLFSRNEPAYRYTSIQFLYVNMLPFSMALSHDVRRVLNDPCYHRRKLVESLFGE